MKALNFAEQDHLRVQQRLNIDDRGGPKTGHDRHCVCHGHRPMADVQDYHLRAPRTR
jgi:hypothetical protein